MIDLLVGVVLGVIGAFAWNGLRRPRLPLKLPESDKPKTLGPATGRTVGVLLEERRAREIEARRGREGK